MVVISRNLLQRSLSILSNIPTQSCRSRLRMDCRCLESLHTNGNSETNHVHTVLAFGDSNTWGFDPSSPGNGAATLRHPYRSRWTTQISEILKQHVHIVPEGLNARTTVLRDPMSPCDGEYNCEGRRDLMVALHSHKPLSCVILALGTNDLKSRFNMSPLEIVGGIRVLVKDVQRATGVYGDGNGTTLCLRTPKILVVPPPIVAATSKSRLWGFTDGVGSRAAEVAKLLAAGGAGTEADGISVLDPDAVPLPSPLDGVHFDAAAHAQLAKAVAERLRRLLDLA